MIPSACSIADRYCEHYVIENVPRPPRCLENVRDSDWGKTGNKKLHTWAFDRIYQYLEYNGEIRGVEVLKENEWNTSKTCSQCGDDTKANRVKRGLYVCQSCELVANADCNGAENMRQKITPSSHGEDRSNGCVAQPSVHLFDSDSGALAPREQVVSYTSKYPICGTGSPIFYTGEDVTSQIHSDIKPSKDAEMRGTTLGELMLDRG